jgi:hypothetical protein
MYTQTYFTDSVPVLSMIFQYFYFLIFWFLWYYFWSIILYICIFLKTVNPLVQWDKYLKIDIIYSFMFYATLVTRPTHRRSPCSLSWVSVGGYFCLMCFLGFQRKRSGSLLSNRVCTSICISALYLVFVQ